jgi:hypothetical protein
MALPTGTVRYRVLSPQVVVRYDLETGHHEADRLDSADELGEISDTAIVDDEWETRLRGAEIALLGHCIGRQSEPQRLEMRGFLDWMQAEPVFVASVQSYAPEFYAWLKTEARD